MTRARFQQVSLDNTPYYHCISRCVRRAYLCGVDPVSGQNFDHRKQWLVGRTKELAAQFAIDVCAYAVMSDHYHLVLFVNEEKGKNWSDDEVIRRWTAIFPRNAAILEFMGNNANSRKAQKHLVQQVQLWRERLMDISWFMRCLNETMARRANKEDDCKGRFWEGRFKSQALLDEKALVTCMAYVDLNPIRSGISETLDSSDYTSIQERLITRAKKVKNRSYRQRRLLKRRGARHLLAGRASRKRSALKPLTEMSGIDEDRISFSQQSYFELLETTRKALSLVDREPAKAIHFLEEKQSVLQSVGIPIQTWINAVSHFHRHYGIAVGTESSLINFHNRRIKAGVDLKYPHKWIRGVSFARLLYGT